MKFIHAADVHLDSPMRGLERYPGAPYARLRAATRGAFTALVDACIQHEVCALILAGDTYDRDWRDYYTGLFFLAELERLRPVGTQVLMVRGNHDAMATMTLSLRLPEFVREFPANAAERIEVGGIAFAGRSFAEGKVTTDLAKTYPPPAPGMLNVGILHTSLDGRVGHEPYAPTSASVLRGLGYDYWALGHVHAREVVSGDPWIVFPGNLQGRSARETGPKGATLVTVVGNKIASVDPLTLDVLRWSQLTVDVGSATSMSDVLDLAQSTILAHVEQSPGRFHAIRLTITGRTNFHGSWAVDDAELVGELRNSVRQFGDVWLEKVIRKTTPTFDLEALLKRPDAIGHLARYVFGSEGAVGDDFKRACALVLSELPREMRSVASEPNLSDDDVLEEVRALIVEKFSSVAAQGEQT